MTTDYLGPNVWYKEQVDIVDGQLVRGGWYMDPHTEPEAYTDQVFPTRQALIDYVVERFPQMIITPYREYTDEEVMAQIRHRYSKTKAD